MICGHRSSPSPAIELSAMIYARHRKSKFIYFLNAIWGSVLQKIQFKNVNCVRCWRLLRKNDRIDLVTLWGHRACAHLFHPFDVALNARWEWARARPKKRGLTFSFGVGRNCIELECRTWFAFRFDLFTLKFLYFFYRLSACRRPAPTSKSNFNINQQNISQTEC